MGTNTPGRLYQVSFELKRQPFNAAMVLASLPDLGVKQSDVVDEESRGKRKISVFFNRSSQAYRLVDAFKLLGIKGVKVRIRIHDRVNWETRWKEDWKAFPLTEKIYLIPLFLTDAKSPADKKPLYLDTTSAFGTGLHETTKFSACLIESLTGSFNSALDVGTGTGVLVAVALISGAGYVEALDIDPGAVNAARQNLLANRLRCNVLKVCDIQKYAVRRKFDLVSANLITHDLVAFKDKIVSCVAPDGHLIISGVSLKNMALAKKEYDGFAGLKCQKVLKGKEWAAFLFKKDSA